MNAIDLRNKNYLEILNIFDGELSNNNLPATFIMNENNVTCYTMTELVIFSRAWNAGYLYARIYSRKNG
jgi:hypothetical protein